MSNNTNDSNLIYGLDDKPDVLPSFIAALQHVLASIIGIVTPTLIIGGALGLGEHVPYLIGMALFVSGVGTFIQAKRVGPVGSGLLSLQGTSFAFLGTVITAGLMVKGNGGSSEDILATIFGVCFIAAFVEIILSFFIDKLKKIFVPTVTGTIILIIGMTLIYVGMTDLAGGFYVKTNIPDAFATHENLALGGVVLLTIIALNRFNIQTLRLSAVFIGMLVGFMLAVYWGKVNFSSLDNVGLFNMPIPFKYGFSFDWSVFLPVSLLFIVTALETTGDLTATSMISKQPISGPVYMQRIKRGVLADGVNSVIASTFNSMPATTFSQNNGVIQVTGVASRHVAIYIAGILVVLGLFPYVGALMQLIPKPVLGGATIIMFATVAMAGIKILAEADLNRRNIMIVAVSLGLAIGLKSVPEVSKFLTLAPLGPDSIITGETTRELVSLILKSLDNPVSLGGVTAIILNLVLPEEDEERRNAGAVDSTAAKSVG